MFSPVLSPVVSLRVCSELAQSVLRVCSECAGAWKPVYNRKGISAHIHFQWAFCPYTSRNFNCTVRLIVAFLCLLHELCALHVPIKRDNIYCDNVEDDCHDDTTKRPSCEDLPTKIMMWDITIMNLKKGMMMMMMKT